MRRLIAVLVTMVSCVTGGIATDSGKPEPASTLPLSTLLPQNSARCIFASVTFISDTTIAKCLQRVPAADLLAVSAAVG